VLRLLRADGIGAAVHYIGANLHPAYADRFPGPFPVSDWASRSLFTLPLHPRVDDRAIAFVADRLRAAASATA
jgi:dTDP-4-amino-4,6-dideoxygalactose transaminase